MGRLKNENGNTTLFIIGLFSVFTLMFLLIISFANVFVEKEHASSNAEQASIVASGIVLDSLEDAISEYDSWLILELGKVPDSPELIDLRPLGEKVEEEKNQLPGTLTDSEKKHKAINKVIKDELNNGNRFLRPIVNRELSYAEAAIRSQVMDNISQNNGEISQTKVYLNNENRIEVETATKYKAFKFDEYFSDSQRLVKQKGQGPSFEFAEALSWNLNISL
ncbi:hypothetical protein DFO73_12420 [Cytobacillus oceanisediminis]|uniref:Flp pilus-assembly TadE/G-like protein n=1 Tax=Cytobacillus oceanisediminis TaxID=665099 RepID=A0A2V2ZCD9_9BACI|nr:hypothetical protein [Cytobacillus oceanisediminis]PWW17618.1 hypothetical protein DFO73_12420 [Cytobacillus oceanisediminis]